MIICTSHFGTCHGNQLIGEQVHGDHCVPATTCWLAHRPPLTVVGQQVHLLLLRQHSVEHFFDRRRKRLRASSRRRTTK